MLGRSLMSLDLADAFLLNVIGLETLLTRPAPQFTQADLDLPLW